MKGLSSRNLKYMQAFADAYPTFVDSIEPDNQLVGSGSIVQAPLAQLTWYQHRPFLIILKAICLQWRILKENWRKNNCNKPKKAIHY